VLGVAIAAGLRRYSYYRVRTKKIKMAITGNGNATKEQVVKCCVGLKELPKTSMHGWFGCCGLSLFNSGRWWEAILAGTLLLNKMKNELKIVFSVQFFLSDR
jgi:hypothetical protein